MVACTASPAAAEDFKFLEVCVGVAEEAKTMVDDTEVPGDPLELSSLLGLLEEDLSPLKPVGEG